MNPILSINETKCLQVLLALTAPERSPLHCGGGSIVDVIKEFDGWDYLLGLLIRHKVAGVAFSRLVELQMCDCVPYRFFVTLKSIHSFWTHRTEYMLGEAVRVIDALNSHGVLAVPLKGTVLAEVVYRDYGCRFLNDIDVLVRSVDRKAVLNILHSEGFLEGNYSRDKHLVEPLSRSDQVLWGLKMFNMPPLIYMSDNLYEPSLHVDVAFGVSYKASESAVDLMLSRSYDYGVFKSLHPEDFFLHICSHLHKEATNEAWGAVGQSENLIKYIDALNFYCAFDESLQGGRLTERALELGLVVPLSHTVYALELLYGNSIVSSVRESLVERKLSVEFDANIYRQGDSPVSRNVTPLIRQLVSL
ncbi:Uncharacterised nucleotidyltransferase [Pseudomonas sp. NFR09]|uniref:nucleotidyltransferase family protein n=1 Tax=Pseudomonas sp. NFR09 TaxID=1566249 RepID=UPI0008C47606|nr:nucleotidyltransferase family protein [Pseudomonas sp. NFR09]SEU14381.1 Uncharacterised nucleotidyltransferase [Pseudomonas sp. NFR09]